MEDRQKNALARRRKLFCALTCWAVGGFVALVLFIALLISGAWSFIQAVFVAGVAFFVVGAVTVVLFCRPLPGPVAPGTAGRGAAVSNAGSATASAPSGPAVGVPASPPSTGASGDSRAGGLEDLQRLRGVGPKLAQTLLDQGVTGIAAIAGWSESDVAWWDENLEGFRGRVSRDAWVDQARELMAQDAAGGDAAP
ncbi:MAG: hypothetical protein ACXIU8_16570 [Alkalilacustris sp.]